MREMRAILSVIFVLCAELVSCSSMPLPFTRELFVTSPMMKGDDVFIAQTLLMRDSAVKPMDTMEMIQLVLQHPFKQRMV